MRRARHAAIEAVALVIPVRDEEERLERCLRSIDGALAQLPPGVAARVVLVLDGCTDASADIAARWPFATLELSGEGVGRARATGVAAALDGLAGVRPDRVWIANTDADSAAPEHWLTAQLALADAGWDVVLGTVAPDPDDLPPELLATPLAHAAMEGEPVYGANLGVRASCYVDAGGFLPLREHEDARLVERLRADGARVTAAYHVPVLTSGRPTGRSPGGYAAYLRNAAAHAGFETPAGAYVGADADAEAAAEPHAGALEAIG